MKTETHSIRHRGRGLSVSPEAIAPSASSASAEKRHRRGRRALFPRSRRHAYRISWTSWIRCVSALSSSRLPSDAVTRARLARARIGRVPARFRQTLPGDSMVYPEGWTRSRRADGRGDAAGRPPRRTWTLARDAMSSRSRASMSRPPERLGLALAAPAFRDFFSPSRTCAHPHLPSSDSDRLSSSTAAGTSSVASRPLSRSSCSRASTWCVEFPTFETRVAASRASPRDSGFL